MRISGLRHYTPVCCVVAVMLAGCGGPQLPLASTGPAQPATHVQWYGRLRLLSAVAPGRIPLSALWPSPVAPARLRTSPQLWYLSVTPSNAIPAYTLPGLKSVYTISGLSAPQGMCTIGKKTFWVANSGADDLLEFSHRGTTPIKTLSVAGTQLASCAVDPTTGNIAAGTLYGTQVFVWKHANGSPTPYTLPLPCELGYFEGYDGSADLFADCFETVTPVSMSCPKAAARSRVSV